jgi:hypothetical protein
VAVASSLLASQGKLETWWGILIEAAVVGFAAFRYLGESGYLGGGVVLGPRLWETVPGTDPGKATLGLTMVAAMVAGAVAIDHPFLGALAGSVVLSFLVRAVGAGMLVLVYRHGPE